MTLSLKKYHSYSNSYFPSIYYLINFVLLMLLNLKMTYLTEYCVMQVHRAQHVHYHTFYILLSIMDAHSNKMYDKSKTYVWYCVSLEFMS